MNGSKDKIIAILKADREKVKSFGVKKLSLFGSVARGEADADSDVDVLVEFEGSATYDRYINLKFHLEELLERKVDLVTAKSLKPRVKSAIEAELLNVT
ncbi:MAG: nucleotidyltransferase family protein [Nitrospinota bacterium]